MKDIIRVLFWTYVIDYGGCVAFACASFFLHEQVHYQQQHTNNKYLSTLVLAVSIQAAVATFLIYFRDVLNFWWLGSRVSLEKKQPISRDTWCHVTRTAVLAALSYIFISYFELVWHEPFEPTSIRYWRNSYFPFYAILILRDLCLLRPLHALMHSSSNNNKHKWYHALHKTHHEPKRNVQSIHAMHIGLVDVLIENVGAPALLFVLQYLWWFSAGLKEGGRVGFSWNVAVMITFHDASLHSINPYTVMYFNPVLDWIFKGNICHQLHHAVNDGDHLLFVPYHHVIPSKRRQDIDKYNRVFRTNYVL